MARITKLIALLALIHWRELKTLEALIGNNLALFGLLLCGLQPESGRFPLLLMGTLIVIPFCLDPLKRIPAERAALLPLSIVEWRWARVLAVITSPAFGLMCGLLLWKGHRSYAGLLALLALAIHSLNSLWKPHHKALAPRVFCWIPRFPGTLGMLIQKNIREQFHLLDTYTALLFGLSGVLCRLTNRGIPRDALWGASLMVVLALSTSAQRLFALDGPHRYTLLPLRGWQVLLAKDLAFLALVTVLVLPLALLPGLTAGMAVLAVGHHPSVLHAAPQARWRFTAGASLGTGVLQILSLFVSGIATAKGSVITPLICAGGWLLSLWIYGRKLE